MLSFTVSPNVFSQRSGEILPFLLPYFFVLIQKSNKKNQGCEKNC